MEPGTPPSLMHQTVPFPNGTDCPAPVRARALVRLEMYKARRACETAVAQVVEEAKARRKVEGKPPGP